MTRSVQLGATVLALVLSGSGCSRGTRGVESASPVPGTFMAALAPPQGVETAARGRAEFVFNGTRVEYVINVSEIEGVMAAHIHQGQTRLVIVPFHVDQPSGDSTGVLVRGTFTPADVSASSPVTFNELVNLMRTGGVYVNVHTEANPGGEIRGEIGVAPTSASRDTTPGRSAGPQRQGQDKPSPTRAGEADHSGM